MEGNLKKDSKIIKQKNRSGRAVTKLWPPFVTTSVSHWEFRFYFSLELVKQDKVQENNVSVIGSLTSNFFTISNEPFAPSDFGSRTCWNLGAQRTHGLALI